MALGDCSPTIVSMARFGEQVQAFVPDGDSTGLPTLPLRPLRQALLPLLVV